MDTPRGVEPRLLGPKPSVLPLDDRVTYVANRVGLEPTTFGFGNQRTTDCAI